MCQFRDFYYFTSFGRYGIVSDNKLGNILIFLCCTSRCEQFSSCLVIDDRLAAKNSQIMQIFLESTHNLLSPLLFMMYDKRCRINFRLLLFKLLGFLLEYIEFLFPIIIMFSFTTPDGRTYISMRYTSIEIWVQNVFRLSGPISLLDRTSEIAYFLTAP